MKYMLASLIVALIFVAQTAAAEGCTCPGLQTIEIMDIRIAERVAKLGALSDGRTESISGYSNDPDVLRQEITEMMALRQRFIDQLAACQQRCFRPEPANLFDVSRSTLSAVAACPECQANAQILRNIEQRLVAAIADAQRFRAQNDIDALRRDAASRSSAPADEANRLEVAYRGAAATHEELSALSREVCDAYENGGFPDDSPAAPEPTPAAAPSLDDTNDLEWDEYNAGWDDYEDPSNERWNEVKALLERMARTVFYDVPRDLGGGAILGAGEELDFYFSLGNALGVFPEGFVLTLYGRCQNAQVVTARYNNSVLQPAYQAWQTAVAQIPRDNNTRLNVYRSLEDSIYRIRTERDQALAALINCNINRCRQQPNVSGLYDPGGMYFEPEGRDETGTPEEDGNVDVEAESGADDGLASDGLTGGNDDEDVAGNAPDMGSLPDTGKPSDDDSGIIFGSGATMPSPVSGLEPVQPPADLNPSPGITGPLVSPYGRDPRVACGISVDSVCANVRDGSVATCNSMVLDWKARCEVWQMIPYGMYETRDACHMGCDLQLANGNLANWLQVEVDVALRETYEFYNSELARRRAETEQTRAHLTARIQEIEDRRVYIYRNTNSGELVHHAGNYFEPTPPLEYVGETRDLTERQQTELRRLQSELAGLNFGDQLYGSPEDANRWYARRNQMLQGGSAYPDPTACSVAEVQSEAQQCHVLCDSQSDQFGVAGLSGTCHPNWMLDLLDAGTWVFIDADFIGARMLDMALDSEYRE